MIAFWIAIGLCALYFGWYGVQALIGDSGEVHKLRERLNNANLEILREGGRLEEYRVKIKALEDERANLISIITIKNAIIKEHENYHEENKESV